MAPQYGQPVVRLRGVWCPLRVHRARPWPLDVPRRWALWVVGLAWHRNQVRPERHHARRELARRHRLPRRSPIWRHYRSRISRTHLPHQRPYHHRTSRVIVFPTFIQRSQAHWLIQ